MFDCSAALDTTLHFENESLQATDKRNRRRPHLRVLLMAPSSLACSHSAMSDIVLAAWEYWTDTERCGMSVRHSNNTTLISMHIWSHTHELYATQFLFCFSWAQKRGNIFYIMLLTLQKKKKKKSNAEPMFTFLLSNLCRNTSLV